LDNLLPWVTDIGTSLVPARYTDAFRKPPHTGLRALETSMRGKSPENQANRPTVLPLSFRLC